MRIVVIDKRLGYPIVEFESAKECAQRLLGGSTDDIVIVAVNALGDATILTKPPSDSNVLQKLLEAATKSY